MNAKQNELMNLITTQMGETVIQVVQENDERFFVGSVETPFGDQDFVQIIGKEISSFFGSSAMMKPAEQVKIDLNTFMANTEPMTIKTSSNSKWWSYSR